MRSIAILTILSTVTCQVSSHSIVDEVRGYTDNEWHQILKGGLGHCSTPGNPCFIGKQSALAVAQAIAFPDPKGRAGFCSDPDSTHAEVDRAQADARPLVRGRVGICSISNMNCFRMRHALEKIGRAAENVYYAIWAREAEAEAEAAGEAGSKSRPELDVCSHLGKMCIASRDLGGRTGGVAWCSGSNHESCLGRRMAAPEADVVARASSGVNNGSCTTPGMLCLRQMPPEWHEPFPPKMGGFCSVLGMGCYKGRKRAEPRSSNTQWCSATGMKCSIRRQELEARLPNDKRSAFCGIPGSTCTEKREIDDFEELGLFSEEGEKLAKFVRELAHGLQTLDPEFDRRECYAEHGPCSDILKARDAYVTAKNSGGWNPENLGSAGNEITEAARAHLHIGDHRIAHDAETSCYGPEGACTNAKRATDELEAAIDEAVALLQ